MEKSAKQMQDQVGEWILPIILPKSYKRKCSLCKKIAYFCDRGCSYKFCPNCGKPMRPTKGLK